MFVFLWLGNLFTPLVVTVKPADQLNLQLGGQCDTGTRHFYARIQQSMEFCKEKHRVFPAWAPVKKSSGVLRCSLLIFSSFLFPPWLHSSAASPLSGPTSCLLSPTQDAPLSSPLCYLDLLFVSAGAVPPISTNGQVGLQRALLCQVHRDVLHARPQICLQQSALACSCCTNSDFSTAPPDTKQPNIPALLISLFSSRIPVLD